MSNSNFIDELESKIKRVVGTDFDQYSEWKNASNVKKRTWVGITCSVLGLIAGLLLGAILL